MDFRAKILIMLSMIALFMSGTAAASDAVLAISSSGNGAFTLQGTGFADVAGMDVVIGYDATILANPKLVQGALISGTMMISSTNSPGMVHIAMVTTRAVAGSGLVATINFDRLGMSSGKVLSLNARLVNIRGASIAVRTQVLNPVDANSTAASGTVSSDATTTFAQANANSQSIQTSPETAVADPRSRYLGSSTINITSETAEAPKQNVTQENIPEQHSVSVGGGQTPEPVTEAKHARHRPPVQKNVPSPENRHVVYKSVLDRFREFKGERTPKSLTVLFANSHMSGVRQEPAVALADGKTEVKVHIRIPSAEKENVNFVLKGARLISLKAEGDTWVVEVLPDKNVYEAGIKVLHNGSVIEIPLAVALPIDAVKEFAGNLDDNKFNLYLKERTGYKIPRFDLNGDGLRNYIDDYIFAANYIVRRKKS